MKNDIYLVHNYTSGIVFTPVGFLSPNRQEKLKNELNSRMDEWMKRMEGESPTGEHDAALQYDKLLNLPSAKGCMESHGQED